MNLTLRVILTCLFLIRTADARELEQLGLLRAGPGEAVSGYLEVPESDGAGARIPVSLLRGAHEGPVLALIAGTHGYEYPGILSLIHI